MTQKKANVKDNIKKGERHGTATWIDSQTES